MTDPVIQLIETMQDDLRSQQNLAELLNNKLDAMKHYDMSRLEALSQTERRLLQGIYSGEKRRQTVLRRATRKLYPQKQDGLASARELAQVSQEPARSKILTLAAMLGGVSEKVQSLNRINALASEKILNHFNHIFRVIAQSGRDIGLYSSGGKKAYLEQNRLVDAIV